MLIFVCRLEGRIVVTGSGGCFPRANSEAANDSNPIE